MKAAQYAVMFDIHLAFCGWVVVSENITIKKVCIGVWVHTNVFPSLEGAFSHSISQMKKNAKEKFLNRIHPAVGHESGLLLSI